MSLTPARATRWMLATLLIAAQAGAAQPATELFDLVVRGGRVIDPESGLDGVRNVGVRDGRRRRSDD